MSNQEFKGADDLQQQVDADWHELNAECPSRAKGCAGLPPLVAHPELLSPPRPYQPEWELALFDLSRVEAYLTQQTWLRIVSQVGQVSLRGYRYGLGVAWAGQTLTIHFQASSHEFVFIQVRPEHNHRLPVPELALAELPGRQLMLPLLMCVPASMPQGV